MTRISKKKKEDRVELHTSFIGMRLWLWFVCRFFFEEGGRGCKGGRKKINKKILRGGRWGDLGIRIQKN